MQKQSPGHTEIESQRRLPTTIWHIQAAGLVELLIDRGGRADVYRLAKQLQLEADDLLPLKEGAALLGFVGLKEGDVEITEEGRAFGEADILRRKVLFREAVLDRVQLLRQVDQTLHAKTDHTIPIDFFESVLAEHFRKKRSSASWTRRWSGDAMQKFLTMSQTPEE